MLIVVVVFSYYRWKTILLFCKIIVVFRRSCVCVLNLCLETSDNGY